MMILVVQVQALPTRTKSASEKGVVCVAVRRRDAIVFDNMMLPSLVLHAGKQ